MKKTFLSMLMIASCFGVANAQLMVDEEGKVAVGIETTEDLISQFSINGIGAFDATMHLESQQTTGLNIQRIGQAGPSPICGIYVGNQAVSYENVGVFAESYKVDPESLPFYSCGVLGLASGSVQGWNFGVSGCLNDTYGTGIFGSSQGWHPNITFNGAYAGFFHGDVYTTGAIYTSSVYTPSDYRLKSDIKSVSSSCLDKVLDMNIVEFKYKQREIEPIEAVENAQVSRLLTANEEDEEATWYDEDKAFMKNKHYGLIAQELQEIYPDLVVEGDDGYLGVNYIEIIPLLVRSIQELNAKVEQYENGNAPIKKAQTRSAEEEVTDIDAVVSALYQNEPNPFTESTTVRCDVNEEVVKADLYIYNMNGDQIAEYAVTGRGATSVTIDGGSLNAGMYLYALIADGKVIDTKRMILTK